jgi:hypothetical protein
MSGKPFPHVITIMFAITFLTSSTTPSQVFIMPPLTDTQLPMTETQPTSTDTPLNRTGQIPGQASPAITQESTSPNTSRDPNFGKLPLYFVENDGQADPQVAYYLLGGSTQVYFTSEGVTFSFIKPGHSLPMHDLGSTPSQKWVVKLDFVGDNHVQPAGMGETKAIVSYFKGGSDQWHAGLSTYSQVVYRNLWPGIDLVYYGQSGKLIYDFLVQPGADLDQIRLRYRGTEGVSLNSIGQMVVSTPLGDFVDEAPVAWQAANGEQSPVSATYQLITSSRFKAEQISPTLEKQDVTDTGVIYSFAMGGYDHTQPLVIDPAVLIYCGYIGGSGRDEGTKIAVDGSGNTYVTGGTWSAQDSFPVTVGPDLTYNGGWDAFVAKVSPSGDALVYAGYIGGALEDYGFGIAVDSDSNAYITGETWSPQNSFPVIDGPDLIYNGYNDAFVAKVSASGTALVYAGYIGGGSGDEGDSIAVDGAGNAYVSGTTASDQNTFPVTVGPDLTFNGTTDAFVAKVSPSGAALIYAGYIGGSAWEWGYGIAVDGSGNAYISGTTSSDQTTFPATVGPDPTYNGGYDAFVAKVNASGAVLIYAGYIGGSGDDKGWYGGIAVDGSGNAYIMGETASTQTSFPVIIGPDLTYNGGEKDAFVAKVSATGAALIYAGYIGGAGGDFSYGIAVDGAGNAYVVGFTSSPQNTFPVTLGPLSTYNGGALDTFIAKVSDSGAQLVYAGYIGGLGTDYGVGIAVDGAGNAYISGSTNSTQDSFPVIGGPDLTYNGGEFDAYIAKVSIVPWTLYLPLTIK